ncbi:hypothetical protein N7510_007354 [Penicillium lagena]|uniref:uncharacterized protein n=1 Tax=Penicillium lagena TaxID=94218 RepID=UPI00253FF444|nr:uncharacterized protein N7510_007354 [Penicillium lagena]KAJ5610635.1 hypothetical protein N7510_007354 [Penicillium lagena]
MYLPDKRDQSDKSSAHKPVASSSKKNTSFTIGAVCIIFGLALCVVIYFGLRYLRQRYSEPKYLPGKYLKSKWRTWAPGRARYDQVSNRPGPDGEHNTSYPGRGPEMTTTSVHRDTSIRSVITLPAYSPSPKPTEQVIGREGERSGMDTVVEYSETAEEQEARREEQMEALYQLRLQRRQELTDREARRRDRREARARGDTDRLEQLAAESRARRRQSRNGSNTSIDASAVLAEHQSRERGRRVSSVSYADVGHVRHDGSRLRANSHESDHRPLLQHTDSSNPSLMDPQDATSRVMSFASSIMSTSTAVTDVDPLALGRSTTHGSSRPLSLADERDLGTLNIPPPPDYEYLEWGDVPAYDSPVAERTPLPRTIRRVPSIQVDTPTPRAASPASPSSFHSAMDERPPSPLELSQPAS